MNTSLLLAVKARILELPQLFTMSSFFRDDQCGTAACIAGWAVTESQGYETPDQVPEVGYNAAELGRLALKLSDEEADRLFYVQFWPRLLQKEYYDAPRRPITWSESKSHYAIVAARRIDHFIATEGRE